MSVDQTLVTARHFDYVDAHTVPEDAFLKKLRSDAVTAGIPAISIGPSQASFLQILLRVVRAQVVIDVGTLAGYSAISMARALPQGGVVMTLELNPKHAEFARQRIAESDVKDKVVVYVGPAVTTLKTFGSDSADAAFLDADKGGYPVYLEECLRIVRKGGLILVDNAFAFGELFAETPRDPETPAVRAFNELMARERRLQSVIVPLGDGCWVGVKL